jgi:hypothetical protein
MTQPVSSYSRTAYEPTIQDDPPATNAGLEFCQNASTVTEGFLCDEPTTISNACRSPTNDLDRFVCDDKKLAGVQASLWDATKDVVKTIASVLVGRMP